MKQGRTYAPGEIFGALLLIGALFAFGLFDFKSDEPLVEAGLRAQATAITATSVHGLRAEVEGRAITLTGLADSAAERDAILERLRALDGRGRLRSRAEILVPAEPFRMEAVHQNGAMVTDGAVPSERVRRLLRQQAGEGVEALTLASGAPDALWGQAAVSALRALAQLQEGRLVLEERALRLTGAALTPEEDARARLLLEDLPPGYTAVLEITLLDDGSPMRLTASQTGDGPPVLRGKLPAALRTEWPGAAIEGSVRAAPFEGWEQGVRTGLEAMTHLRMAHLAIVGSSFTLTGTAFSPVARGAALQLLETLPAPFQISVEIALVDDGAPFLLILSRDPEGGVASGKVPRSLSGPVLEGLIDGPVDASGLTIAQVSPGEAWWQAAALGARALRIAEQGEMRLEETGLSLTAQVRDPAAAARVERILADLPEGVRLGLALDLRDDGTPLRLSLVKGAGGIRANGKWPDDLSIDALAADFEGPLTAGDVVRAVNPGPPHWSAAAQTAARALALSTRGEARLEGRDLYLSAILRDPATETELAAVLDTLPEGYNATTDLRFQDDGRPFAFRLVFDGQRAILSGKTPSDLGPASQAAILGHPVEASALVFAVTPADVGWWGAARAALKALGTLRHGTLEMDAHRITLTGSAADSVTAQEIADRFAASADEFIVLIDIAAE